ncbi:MAG: ORF6N domain-containing protein [Verrucomicrobiota bacterium]|nr:ORF6N domain-containing protein [Verrucomicrobiota bacterium]
MKPEQTPQPIEPLIINLRGQRVILDADLAGIYGVPTKRLNEQVKRNSDRFPEDFMFRLTEAEKAEVVANCDHLQNLKFSPQLPAAFTEHGAIMAASVLNSPEAVAMSVFVVRAFVQMRERLTANAEILKRLAEIDKTLLEHNDALGTIWQQLQPLLAPPPDPPKRKIGFDYKGNGE